MTVAAIEAGLLETSRREGPVEGLPARFLKAAAKPIQQAWDLAAMNDLRFQGVEGPRLARVRIAHWYSRRLAQAPERDRVVSRAMLELLTPDVGTGAVMRPSILRRVLFPGRSAPAPDDAREAARDAVRDVLRDVEDASDSAR